MGVEIGQILADKYRITRKIGVGGMGTVYEALHLGIKRRVAIKVLHPHVAVEESLVRRFEREAQAAARVGSRHIVDVLDSDSLPGGDRYMVMELLEGDSLSKVIKRGIELVNLFAVALEVLEGLADAHDAEVVHRDLKPANIILCVGGRRNANVTVKIVDFGVSKLRDLSADSATSTGVMMGTPHYMAPEQTSSKAADPRADLYSLGVILFRGIARRLPYEASSMPELIAQLLTTDAPPLDAIVKDVHPAVSALVAKALARDPDDRFQSADAFTEAIRACLVELGLPPDPPVRIPEPPLLLTPTADTTPYVDDKALQSPSVTTKPQGSFAPDTPELAGGASVSPRSSEQAPSAVLPSETPQPFQVDAETVQMPTPISQPRESSLMLEGDLAVERHRARPILWALGITVVLGIGAALAVGVPDENEPRSSASSSPSPDPVQVPAATAAAPEVAETAPEPTAPSPSAIASTPRVPADKPRQRPLPRASAPPPLPPPPPPKQRTDKIRTDL